MDNSKQVDQVLVFDIWGEYAHFRKYYTTTSPLSYSIPPRTVLTGLIGAITGFKKEEYLKHFAKDQAFIAIRLLKPIKKIRFSMNLIDIKKGTKNRSPTRFEFIKDAKYRIYFFHTDGELYEKTRSLIAAHKCIYTPYLGITEHIANYKIVGEVCVKQIVPNDFEEIHSAISENMIEKVDFGVDGEYFSETMPMEMDMDRTVTEYSNILFERDGKTITAKLKKLWKLDNGENIVFM